MSEKNDMKLFGILMLALFSLMITTGLVYIGADYMKETACEQNVDDAHVWASGVCTENSSSSTEVTIKAVTKIGVVESTIDIVLGLLSLVVIVLIFKVILKVAKSTGA